MDQSEAERSRLSEAADVPGAPVDHEKVKVAFAIPCQDTWKSAFADSFAQCLLYTDRHLPNASLTMFQERGTLLHNMRKSLAQHAVECGATHIMWLDSDMVFPPDTVVRLLAHKKPIVAANYTQRRAPCSPVAKSIDGKHWLYTDHMSFGLEAAIACGMGCMLTEAGVFTALPEPWFDMGAVDNPEEGERKHREVGEDFWFCYNVSYELGVHPWIDHDLSKQVGHVGEYIYDFEDALRDRVQLRLIKEGVLPKPPDVRPAQKFADLVDVWKRKPAEEVQQAVDNYHEMIRAKEEAEEAEWLAGLEAMDGRADDV